MVLVAALIKRKNLDNTGSMPYSVASASGSYLFLTGQLPGYTECTAASG